MKTKILLIGIIIFLVNVISVNARETIKSCMPHDKKINADGWNNLFFPSDGSKPYGLYIEYFLKLTHKLNLELVVIKVKDINECTAKMRTGEVDLMTNLSDKDDRRDYMELIPFLTCSKLKWDCPGNQKVNYGISKKSKFISRIAEFKSAVLLEDDYVKIYNTPFKSADQHDWDGKKKKRLVKKSVINESIGIKGYKDFKFGMTYDQIKATGVCEEFSIVNESATMQPGVGCYKVAGKKRFIEFHFTTWDKNDLKAIVVSLGESTKEYFNKLVKGIGKKYKELYRLTREQRLSLNKGNMIVFFADGRITLLEDEKWINLIYTREVSPFYKRFAPENVSSDDF